MSEQPDAGQVAGEDTSAVLAALESEKSYLPEPQDAPEAEGQDEPGEDAPAAADEGEADAPKPKKTAQERIDEVTRARREAEREAEYWKAKALQSAQTQPAPAAQQQPQEGGRPDPNDYEYGVNDPAYIEDLTDWKAEEAAHRVAIRARHEERQRVALENYETRARALFPEGKPSGLTAFERIETLPELVLEIVGQSDIGPKIAAHLGDNPADLARIARLPVVQQAIELGRLESRLAAPKAKATPPPKTVTDAPEPAPQARGAGGQFKVAPDTNDFAAFEKQYRIG